MIKLIRKYHKSSIIIVSSFYALCLMLALAFDHQLFKYLLIAFPFVALALYFSFFHPLYFIFSLLFLLPLSVNLKDYGLGIGISLPGEVMTLWMAVLVIVRLFRKNTFDKNVFSHPVSIAIAFNLIWMVITTFTSTMPLISVKYVFIRMLYLLVFYLLFSQLFQQIKNIQKFFWFYTAGMLLIIFHALYRHAQYSFIQEVSFYTPKPFFNDHTIYGACMAMLVAFFIFSFFLNKDQRVLPRFLNVLVIVILLTGIFFSFSRAVWISLFIMIVLYLGMLVKIRFYQFIGMSIIVFAVLWFMREPILRELKKVDSQRGSDLKEHIGSAANIESSASNRERINRWTAGFSMFKEKPVLGFGPGTYPFQYAPYQKEEFKTRLSTDFGDVGGVHSEYLKPLTESGILGMISFLTIILLTIRSGLRIIYYSKDKSMRLMAISLLLGLTTYYVHGLVNFFLDTDKPSALFWGMTAFIVLLDLKYQNETSKNTEH